jgi:unsaturated rhamnogalacturonyl hydrolase
VAMNAESKAKPKDVAPEIVELANRIVRRLRPSQLAWSWGEGLLLYALLRLDAMGKTTRYVEFAEAFFRHHAARPRVPTWSDQCPPGLAALELHGFTGRAEHLAVAEGVAHYIRSARRTKDGGLNHFGVSPLARFYPESMWVDSLMMYGVFAARWGRAMRDSAMTRFAVEQPPLFARVLRDPRTGLYRHCWWVRARKALPSGDGNWLRGNGWALASLVEVLEAVPTDHEERGVLVAMLRGLALALVPYQLPSGLFTTVLGRPSYPETSGSALVAYALLAGARAGYLPNSFVEPGNRAYRAVAARLERGTNGMSMPDISTATMPYPVWIYPHIPRVRDAPHGVAAMILAGIASAGASAVAVTAP